MWDYITNQYAALQEQYTAMRSAIGPLRSSKTELLGLAIRKTRHDAGLLPANMMEDWHEGTWTHQFFISLALAAAVWFTIERTRKYCTSFSRRRVPTLKLPKGLHPWDYPAVLVEGARQYPNTPYTIRDDFGYEYVVYPSSSFNEVKHTSTDKASKIDFSNHVYLQNWPCLDIVNSSQCRPTTSNLTRGDPGLVHECQRLAKSALEKALGPCTEWKSVPIYSTFQEILAIMNSTSLVGSHLGTDQHWLNDVQRYPIFIMVAASISHATPWFLRPLVSTVVRLPAWYIYWRMTRLLRPKAEQELRESKNETLHEGRTSKPGDKVKPCFPIMASLMPRYHLEDRALQQITHDYITRSIQLTTLTATSLYSVAVTLITRPELMDDLREELSQIMVEGHLPQPQMSDLQVMDSFIRESSRYNIFSHCMPHPGQAHHLLRNRDPLIPRYALLVTLLRRLQDPLQLSVGPTLPAGSLICVDAYHILRSHTYWESPEKFDLLRFHKRRQQPGLEAQHELASLAFDQPHWGGGVQDCSGSLFASATVKLLLVNLLSGYEIKMSPGARAPKVRTMSNGTVLPDLGARMMIRARK